MRSGTLTRFAAMTLLSVLMLVLAGLMLFPAKSANSIGVARSVSLPLSVPSGSSTAPITDTRWVALIQSTAPHGAAASSMAVPPSINIYLTSGMIAGHASTAAAVNINVTRNGGQVAYATATPFPNEGSYFYLIYPSWVYVVGGYSNGFQSGDVVWVAQAGASISMTVPSLSGLADASNDRMSGVAPSNQPVTVYLFPFASPDLSYTRAVTADVSGQYQVVWSPAIDLRAHDSGYVVYAEAPDRQTYTNFVAPFLRAQVGGPNVSGLAAPLNTVVITVANTDGTPRLELTNYTASDGSFRASAYLHPGDRVTATCAGQVFSMTVLTVTAQTDVIHGEVSGVAPVGYPVEVMRYAGPLSLTDDKFWSAPPDSSLIVTASASGQYSATASLSPADYGAAVVTSSDGHQTYARFAVPYVSIQLGDLWPTTYSNIWLWGQVDDVATPITLTIQGPSGYLKDLRYLMASDNGFFADFTYGTQLPALETGDVITFATARANPIVVAVPVLTAQANPLSDTVAGFAPPNTPLTLNLFSYGVPTWPDEVRMTGGGGPGPSQPPYSVVVTSTPQGDFQINFNGVLDITPDTTGQLQLTTPEGYTLVRVFRADEMCQPFLTSVQVGGSVAGLQLPPNCVSQVTFRLRDVQGHLKFEQYLGYFSYVYLTLYNGEQPVPILPGDSIELEQSTLTMPTATPWPDRSGRNSPNSIAITLIPSLTVNIDPAINLITGYGPPDAVLRLDVYRQDTYQTWLTTTVNAQGSYSATIPAYQFIGGDQVKASYKPISQPVFTAIGGVPVVQATLYQSQIQGWLPPLSLFTATLESVQSITAATTTGYAATTGGWSVNQTSLWPGNTIVVTTPISIRRLTLPALSAHIDRASASVSGQAPPNARLEVDLFTSDGYYQIVRSQAIITATSAGNYTTSFPEIAPLPGAWGLLTYFDADGDQASLEFATEQWHVAIDNACIDGSTDEANAPITVTLQSNDGTLKDKFTGFASAVNGAFYGCFGSAVQSGDRLTLIYPSGQTTFTVPNLTAVHAYARQVLEGQSMPNSAIAATFPFGRSSWPVRHTIADANGRYGLDTSDLHLLLGQTGYAMTTDQAGNTVQRDFTITGYRAYLPVMLK